MLRPFVQLLNLVFSHCCSKMQKARLLYCPYPLSVSIPAMMIGHITLFGLAEIILTVVVLTFVEKVTPKALDVVPDKTAFKPLYILMAVTHLY